MFRFNEPKNGRLVGTDELGNKYYENNRYFVGRNRWVDYNQDTWSAKWDYNASQVTPEWYESGCFYMNFLVHTLAFILLLINNDS